MKRVELVVLSLITTLLPCSAESVEQLTSSQEDSYSIAMLKNKNPKLEIKTEKTDSNSHVFIYHLSDGKFLQMEEPVENNNEISEENTITSDDVTADTSIKPVIEEKLIIENYESNNNEDEYFIDDMYSDVLKGYAQYNEEEENTISLEDFEEEFLTLDIRRPSKVLEQAYANLRTPASKFNTGNSFSKYKSAEYSIEPLYSTNYRSYKGFSAGTTFYQGIDTGELEQASGIFSRYENKYFAINTSYRRTINSTNNNYNDNLYFSPELRLNQYFTLREVFSTDMGRNTKKAEFILSINPFGNRDTDRLRVEFGASQSYSPTNEVIKNQFRFLTRIKL
ncbi:hypothetical protein HDR58_02305 [bacterium]|nr:hypothetical protein [bacterium]